jgi:hypothetical protein
MLWKLIRQKMEHAGMRRLFFILFSLSLILPLAACGGGSGTVH